VTRGLRRLAVAAGGAVLIVSPAPASADIAARSSDLVVYGSDPCPKSDADEIVVCHRRPERERYRIPMAFRDPPRRDSANMAWSQQWQQLEDATRSTRPNSCSVVGTGGQTGCLQSVLRQWWLERRSGY
jgi:hypothetical protein